MRRSLLLTLLLTVAGCQAMQPCDDEACVRRRRIHGGLFGHRKVECESERSAPITAPKKDEPPARPENLKSPPRPVVAEPPASAPVVAQDILLVPKTVYVPYAAQTPVGVMRMSGAPVNGAPSAPVTAPPPGDRPAPVKDGPKPSVDEPKDRPCDLTREMLDMCRKLNERLDCLERKQREIIVCPPTVVPSCPPAPLFPLFRRPLFPRCETFQPCEPCPTPIPLQSTPVKE